MFFIVFGDLELLKQVEKHPPKFTQSWYVKFLGMIPWRIDFLEGKSSYTVLFESIVYNLY